MSEEVFGDLNTYTVTNLHCGMRYDFYITTLNGNGEQSDIVSARTSGRGKLRTLFILAAKNKYT